MEPKEVVWRWDYGVYVPFCPHCDEPAYEKDGCCFCGKPYKYVDGEYQPTKVIKGEYTVVQSTNNHIAIYRNERMVMHIAACKKFTKDELLKEIDRYEYFSERSFCDG